MDPEFIDTQEAVIELLESNGHHIHSTTIDQYTDDDPVTGTLKIAIELEKEPADGADSNPYRVK